MFYSLLLLLLLFVFLIFLLFLRFFFFFFYIPIYIYIYFWTRSSGKRCGSPPPPPSPPPSPPPPPSRHDAQRNSSHDHMMAARAGARVRGASMGRTEASDRCNCGMRGEAESAERRPPSPKPPSVDTRVLAGELVGLDGSRKRWISANVDCAVH